MHGRPGALELVPAREHFTAEPPTVTAYDSEAEEAAGIAAGVAARIADGASPSEIAVLYRAHAQSAVLQQALAAEGIATSVLGGTRFFAMPEVRQAILALRAAAVAPTEHGFLPGVRRVLRELGLTEEPPAAGELSATAGRRDGPSCGSRRMPDRKRPCDRSATSSWPARRISTSRRCGR